MRRGRPFTRRDRGVEPDHRPHRPQGLAGRRHDGGSRTGRIADEADVVEYRDMVTIIRDRIQEMIKKGMTLEQVQAAKPTYEYDGRYGSTTGPWTTEMFVEAAYRDLSQ